MSQFRLGERYGSEDMYRDMGIRPGERVAYQGSDGLIYTGTVENITYSSGKPAIYPTLTRWQQLKRRLTPRRWRKPIKPIREATSDEFTITANKFDDGIGWAYVADDAPTPTGTIIDGIIKTEPGEPK
ncbi:hypothetical protein [Mycobacterium colombiense]